LGKHVLGCRIKIREHLNGNASISHKWRYALHNLFVFIFLFLRAQSVTGCKESLNLRILSNQSGIRGLAINKSEQPLDPEGLARVPIQELLDISSAALDSVLSMLPKKLPQQVASSIAAGIKRRLVLLQKIKDEGASA
jgi:hypothetical protein